MKECPGSPAYDNDIYWTYCIGTYTWSNGDKYVGEWKDNERHGQGTYFNLDDNEDQGIYVGEYKDGKMHGQGTYFFAEGDKYVGEFKDGGRHGHGTFTFPDGENYLGEWKDDTYNGRGTYTYANGNKYVGNFRDGKFNGSGYFVIAETGNVIVGIYKNGKIIDGDAEVYDSSGKYLTT